MRERPRRLRSCSLVLAATICLAPASADDEHMVRVDGRLMRVRTLGMAHAQRGRPTVVFQSGAGTGLTAWVPVLGEVARFAPVVAYDRPGFGASQPDGQKPTPKHVAEQLHALLALVQVKPPYVLVGHSWGGLLIRMFASMYPKEVAGLVYVDPTDPRSPEQDLAYLRASGYTAEGARQYVDRHHQEMADFVGSQSGAYRAEMEVILANELNYFAEFRELSAPPVVPVALLVSGRFVAESWTGRPCDPPTCHRQWMQLRLKSLKSLAPVNNITAVTVADESGHEIQRDDPALVVSAIRRVLSVRTSP